MLLASLLEYCSVKLKHFNILHFFLAALADLETVMFVSLPVQYEFQEVCITYKASVKQFSISTGLYYTDCAEVHIKHRFTLSSYSLHLCAIFYHE